MTAVGYSRPVRCLGLVLLAWLSVLLMRALPIGGSWQSLDWQVWTALLGWLAAYVVGFILIAQVLPQARAKVMARHPGPWVRRWIKLLSLIAIGGALLIAYEFAVLRGYGFTTPVALIRSQEVQNAAVGFGGSLVSGFGRLFTPALQVAWLLAVLRWRDIAGLPKALLLLATATVFWEQTMYEGGRFFLATLLANCLVAKALATWQRVSAEEVTARRPARRRVLSWPVVALTVAALTAFALVFLNRAIALELDLGPAYAAYTRTFDVDVGGGVLDRLTGVTGPLWFVAAMFWIYITQGPNELAVLMADGNLVHAGGLFQFPQLGQAISKITGSSVGYDVFAYLPNVGTYNTFAGAGYIDFGLFGSTLSALLLGSMTAAAVAAFNERRMTTLTLWAPVLMTLGLFAPIISLVTNVWPALVWASVVGVTARRRPGSAAHAPQ